MATHPLDAMSAAAAHHHILFENDEVRILDTNVKPGERTPVHAHEWPAALYVISWSDFIRYDAFGNVMLDSRSMPSAPPVGSSFWIQPLGPHSVLNVGNSDLHIVAVEVKAR